MISTPVALATVTFSSLMITWINLLLAVITTALALGYYRTVVG